MHVTARIYFKPDVFALLYQVPFVLGWPVTVHLYQCLTISEAVLDLELASKAGMVHAATIRVGDKNNLKSFV